MFEFALVAMNATHLLTWLVKPLAETKLLTFALALAAEAPVIAPFSAEVTVITATLGALTVRSIIATLTSLTWLFATGL